MLFPGAALSVKAQLSERDQKEIHFLLVLFVTVLILTMAKIEIFKPHSKLCENGLYHGCYGVYKDGTRKLITGNCSRCKYPTNDPFWMKAEEVNFKVRTRVQKEKLEMTDKDKVLKYFTKTVNKDIYNDFEIKPTENEARYMTVSW